MIASARAAVVYIVTGVYSIYVGVTYDGAPCLLDRFQFVEGHIRKDIHS